MLARSRPNMVKRILYATDLGLFGPYMLEHVSELANCHSAKVTVLHAVEPLSLFADALLEAYVPIESKQQLKLYGVDQVMATIRDQVKHAFQDNCIDFDGNLDWIEDVKVLRGAPADVILEQAEQLHADMIVLGSHGGRSGAFTPIGSVATKVLQLARVPVYLVPTSSSRHSGFPSA